MDWRLRLLANPPVFGNERLMARVLSEMLEQGRFTRPRHFCQALEALGQAHFWKQTFRLLDVMVGSFRSGEMTPRPLSPTYVKLGEMMEDSGRWLAAEAFEASATACGNAEQWPWALRVLARSAAEGFPVCGEGCSRASGAARDAWRQSQRWDLALDLLAFLGHAALEPDAANFQNAIDACGHAGRWTWGLLTLQRLRGCGVESDAYAYATAMSSCAGDWRWWRSLCLLDELGSSGLRADFWTCASLVSACTGSRSPEGLEVQSLGSGSRRWADLLSALCGARRDGLPSTTAARTALIGACGRGSSWEQALELVPSSARAPAPAWVEDVRWDEGVEEWEVLPESRLLVVRAAITACRWSGKTLHAFQLLKEAHDISLGPDTPAFNAVLGVVEADARRAALCRAAAALRGAGRQGGEAGGEEAISDKDLTWSWNLAFRLLKLMLGEGPRPDMITYKALLNTCGWTMRSEEVPSLLAATRGQVPLLALAEAQVPGDGGGSTAPEPRALLAEAAGLLERHGALTGSAAAALLRGGRGVLLPVRAADLRGRPARFGLPASGSSRASGLPARRSLEELGAAAHAGASWKPLARSSSLRAARESRLPPVVAPSPLSLGAWTSSILNVPLICRRDRGPRARRSRRGGYRQVRRSRGRPLGLGHAAQDRHLAEAGADPLQPGTSESDPPAVRLALSLLLDFARKRRCYGRMKRFVDGRARQFGRAESAKYCFISCAETFAIFGRDVFVLPGDLPAGGDWSIRQAVSFRVYLNKFGHPAACKIRRLGCRGH